MTVIRTGRKKQSGKFSAAAVSAALCTAVCAVSLIAFSSGYKSLPAPAGSTPVSAFSSAAEEDSFWESYAKFSARLFFG